MNDTQLKALSAHVKKLTARVEALERPPAEDHSPEACLRETIGEGAEELEAS
jgi:hypothetical protein